MRYYIVDVEISQTENQTKMTVIEEHTDLVQAITRLAQLRQIQRTVVFQLLMDVGV